MNKEVYAILILAIAASVNSQALNICWRTNYGRGVGTIPKNCKEGQEYDAGLCYKKCDDGYTGVGPVCWQNCPEGYTDTGAFCQKGGHVIAKKSYGRGVGTIPIGCVPPLEEDAGLCYKPCGAGYKEDGPVCWAVDSGDPFFSIKCDYVAYGHTDSDCSNLKKVLDEAGISSVICLAALAESIIEGHPVGPQECIKKIEDVTKKLYGTHECRGPTSPVPTTSLPPDTTTAAADTSTATTSAQPQPEIFAQNRQ